MHYPTQNTLIEGKKVRMIEHKTLTMDEVETGGYYKNCHLMAGEDEDSLRFSDVTFERCEFQQQVFEDSEWLDCHFVNIHFANATFDHSVFYRCTFHTCQLTGTNFYHNHWKNTKVIDSKANYININDSTIETCTFTDTNLIESSFQSVKIKKGLKFVRCDMNDADFLDTRLKDVDFSKSYFDSLRVSIEQLKGAIISPLQASVFIQFLGVQISDD